MRDVRVLRPIGDDAEAHRNAVTPSHGGEAMRRDRVAYAHREVEGAVRLRVGKQNRELIAPRAGNEIARAGDFAQQRSQIAHDAVASEVAIGVVDLLEDVDVDGDEGEARPLASGTSDLTLELLLEATPVETSAEGIGEHHLRELGAQPVVRATEVRDAVGAAIRLDVVRRREVALFGVLEQARETREPTLECAVLKDERSGGQNEHTE